MSDWVLVPKEPTEAMLKASRNALTELIESVPEPERTKRFGKPTERGYQIPGPDKTVARWRAMLAACPSPNWESIDRQRLEQIKQLQATIQTHQEKTIESPGINDDKMAFHRRVYLDELRKKP